MQTHCIVPIKGMSKHVSTRRCGSATDMKAIQLLCTPNEKNRLEGDNNKKYALHTDKNHPSPKESCAAKHQRSSPLLQIPFAAPHQSSFYQPRGLGVKMWGWVPRQADAPPGGDLDPVGPKKVKKDPKNWRLWRLVGYVFRVGGCSTPPPPGVGRAVGDGPCLQQSRVCGCAPSGCATQKPQRNCTLGRLPMLPMPSKGRKRIKCIVFALSTPLGKLRHNLHSNYKILQKFLVISNIMRRVKKYSINFPRKKDKKRKPRTQ